MTSPRQGEWAATRYARSRAFLRKHAGPRLSIDVRALSAFRIALGALLLADLVFLRVPGLVPFYTDSGVLPRSTLAETYPTFATLSLHAVSGSAWVQGVLFAIAGCFAVFVLVGYRTRLSLTMSLLLLTSLYARNPLVVNGGDTILLTFVFLGLFLPLDRRWSLTDTHPADDQQRVRSLGTAILLLHFVSIYVANALYKSQSDPWMAGTAVPRIFQLEEYVVLLGPYLAEYPVLLTGMNWLWIAVNAIAIFLIIYTGRLRTALVAAFVAVHLGMAATMRLGAFPFVMIAGLLVFLPSPVWDRFEEQARELKSAVGPLLPALNRSKDGENGRAISIPAVTLSPPIRRGAQVGTSVLLVGFFLTTVFWQAAGVGLVDSSPSGLDGELSEGSWAFFAPNPPDTSSWYVVEVTLESGETIDAATGEEVTFDPPPDAAATYPTALWHRYGSDVRYADETYYEPAAEYVCHTADRDIESVTIHHVRQPVDANGPVSDPLSEERITTTC